MIINTLKKKNIIKKILNFIYYLRYLILIFILSIILLFATPKLFKNVNKIVELNNILKNQHGFIIKKTNKINYKIFPQPNLEIKDSIISIGEQFNKITIKELKIFTNLKSLYVSNEMLLKKISFKGEFLGQDVSGYYIPKKSINLLYFEIKNLGIKSKVFFDNTKKFPNPSGKIELNVLDDNLLINFDYGKNLKIQESVYKNKNIHTNFNGELNFDPYFYFKILADIKKLNFEKLKLKKLYHFIIDEISNKKINGELNINYSNKKITEKIGKKNKINMIFNNGDIISENSSFHFANLNIQINFFLKKYPSFRDFNYELLVKTEDINKFFKKIGIKKDKNLKKFNISIDGRINLDAQKYYFDKILINKNNINENKLTELKYYFDKNFGDFISKDLDEKNFFLSLKDLLKPT